MIAYLESTPPVFAIKNKNTDSLFFVKKKLFVLLLRQSLRGKEARHQRCAEKYGKL